MSVVVNQLNHAVSQTAVDAVVTARRFTYSDLFALHGGHNIVNGMYVPFTPTTDSGWWGSVLSDTNGYLPVAGVMQVNKRLSAHHFRLAGIQDNYPVDFTLTLYLDGNVLYSKSVTNNSARVVDITLNYAMNVDSYVLTITRISKSNEVLKVSTASFDVGTSNLMKEPGRRIRGKVEVTYMNALHDAAITVSEGAYASSGAQLSNGAIVPSAKFFKLYDNKLDGTYRPIDASSSFGWWPKTLPDAYGVYAVPQVLRMDFSVRNIYNLSIYGDAINNAYPSAFTLDVYHKDGTRRTFEVTDLTVPEYHLTQEFTEVIRLDITIRKSSKPYIPAIVMEVPITTSITYEADRLVDISLLEELTYEDAIEKLGGVSANELTVNFSNEDRSFYFNNQTSRAAKYLKKNRRIRAWLGVDIPDSEDETIWSPLGTFWTHRWDIPTGALVAKATAFDTLGLLGTKKFFDHRVYRNRSFGWLLETIFNSAKSQIPFIEWSIEASLYDTIIPVAWFAHASYTEALNRIASCDIVHIYCDRTGRIIASKRLSGIQSPDDVWSDSTNIIDKNYPTLNTAPPNYIDVKVSRIKTSVQDVLSVSNLNESVSAGEVRLFNFSAPAESISSITINTSATYTYEWYSWGLRVQFTSNGTLNSVVVSASALEVDTPSTVHLQDDIAIDEDGVIPCEITSDFIQTTEHARYLAQYLYGRLSESIYDVDVTYRGDIALTLNNKIHLAEGIAPNNLYYIKRHELYWNGGLSGTASLST